MNARRWQCTVMTSCVSDDDGHKHIDKLFTSKYTAKDTSTLGFADSDVKSFLLLNCVFRVGKDQTGQYSDIEPDLRHAPLIINESGGNANTKTVSEYTSRETTRQVGVRRKKESDSAEIKDATRYRSPCMRHSFFGPRQTRLCRNREAFGPPNE